MRKLWLILAAALTLNLSGCGYNRLQSSDEQTKASWSEVLNQYQRRADLIPNLVNTVKGYAAQEQAVLLGVTNARAKVGSIQATPELLNVTKKILIKFHPDRYKGAFSDLANQITLILNSGRQNLKFGMSLMPFTRVRSKLFRRKRVSKKPRRSHRRSRRVSRRSRR